MLFDCLPADNPYPLRIRVVKDDSGEKVWLTAGYIPVVRQTQEPESEQRATRRRRAILQHVLDLVFRTAMAASHVGSKVRIGM